MIGDVVGLQPSYGVAIAAARVALHRRTMIVSAIARSRGENSVTLSRSPTRIRSGYASRRPPSARIFTDARNDNPLPPPRAPTSRVDHCRRPRSSRPGDDRSTSTRDISPGDRPLIRTRWPAREGSRRPLAYSARAQSVRQSRDRGVEVELEAVVGRRRLRARTSVAGRRASDRTRARNGWPSECFSATV